MSKQDKRRLVSIGPGLIIALAISVAIIGMKYVKMEKQAAAQRSTPPIIERHAILSTAEEKSGLTPEVKFIIDRSRKIGLSNAQLSELHRLQSEWEKLYRPKLEQANKAASKANEYLSGAEDQRRTPVAHIQDRARPLVTLSGEVSAARRRYWDRAVETLTPDQRKTIQTEREIAWAAKTNTKR
jgi:hypothetical protein